MEIVSSNQAPKFLTDEAAGARALPTLIPLTLILHSCCRVPIATNSVLSSFNIRPLLVAQFLMSATQFCMASMALSSFNARPLLAAQFLMSSTGLCMASMALSSLKLEDGLKDRQSWTSSANKCESGKCLSMISKRLDT